MIKSSDIIKLLKDKNADLSKEEIEKIIEEELLKEESEMDTDLIEMCLDALKERKPTPAKKPKKPSYVKFAFFAAAAVVLILVNVSAFGKLNRNTPPVANKNDILPVTTQSPETLPQESSSATTKTTTTEANPAPILKEETTKAPKADKSASTVSPDTVSPKENLENVLKKLLKVNGFDNIILPRNIFESSQILSKNFEETQAYIKIKSGEKIYNITIEKSSEAIEENNALDVNGLKVLVENENNSSEIRYRKNNLNYRIVFESSYEEAVRIAKAIC